MDAVIHVVDDDESLRRALSRLLLLAGFQTRSYASAGDFLLAPHSDGPGCVLLDLRMPGPGGLELQEALSQQDAPMPIIFLTGHGDIPTSVCAMKAGAVDFLTKPVESELLLDAVRRALARNTAERSAREHKRMLKARYTSLTQREREVFALVVTGLLNKQVAAELGASERTVKAHRAKVMEKFGAKSVAALVRAADQLKDVVPPAIPRARTPAAVPLA